MSETNINSINNTSTFLTFFVGSLYETEINYEKINKINREIKSASGTTNGLKRKSTLNENVKKLSDYELEIIYHLAKQENENREYFVESSVKTLHLIMTDYNYDEESEELVWKGINEVLAKEPLPVLGEIFQILTTKYYDSVSVLCAVAKCLCSFEPEETEPWGYLILIALLNHSEDLVKEYAVMLLQNWKSIGLLPILKNLDCRAEWLRDYINDVIGELES